MENIDERGVFIEEPKVNHSLMLDAKIWQKGVQPPTSRFSKISCGTNTKTHENV